MVKGSGQYLYDELGRKYLDCINNVAHVGHSNKRVGDAVSKQMSLLSTNSRFLHENLSLYAKRLVSLFPAQLSVCYLVNSGSEANDLAMRLARAYTGAKDIVSLEGAYHGNLTSTMAISPYKTDHLRNFKRAKWAHVAPMPCAYRGRYTRKNCSSQQEIGAKYARASADVIEQAKASGRKVAAFFVESMVSCGAQTPLPEGYLMELKRHLNEQQVLLVCDEVQTGFGRCGKHMWAFELAGPQLTPDIVTVGKPMGNGFPVSAVITTRAIASSFMQIGTEYFNTFGGNPTSCAAALAVLDEIQDLKLMQQAQTIGGQMLDQLKQLQRKHANTIGDVRGHGYFIGIEIIDDATSELPSAAKAKYLVQRFRDEQILMSSEGVHENVLKFKPPMVFNATDADRFMQVLAMALAELDDTTQQVADLSAAGKTVVVVSDNRSDRSSSGASSSSASSRDSVSSLSFESSCEL